MSPTVAILATKAALASAFCGFLSAVILREVLQHDEVDADTIRGAICAYLFVGVCWAGAYAFVEELSPGSLTIPGGGAWWRRRGSAAGNAPLLQLRHTLRHWVTATSFPRLR